MLHHRHNVHDARLGSLAIHHQLDEADQCSVKICPDEDASIQKSFGHPSDCCDVLSEMRKWLALPERTLVVYLPNALHECIIERSFTDNNPLLFGLTRAISRDGTE